MEYEGQAANSYFRIWAHALFTSCPFHNAKFKNHFTYRHIVVLEMGTPFLPNKVKILGGEGTKLGQKYVLQTYFTYTIFSNNSDSNKIDKTIPSKHTHTKYTYL